MIGSSHRISPVSNWSSRRLRSTSCLSFETAVPPSSAVTSSRERLVRLAITGPSGTTGTAARVRGRGVGRAARTDRSAATSPRRRVGLASLHQVADGRHQLGTGDRHGLGLDDDAPETTGGDHREQDRRHHELPEPETDPFAHLRPDGPLPCRRRDRGPGRTRRRRSVPCPGKPAAAGPTPRCRASGGAGRPPRSSSAASPRS